MKGRIIGVLFLATFFSSLFLVTINPLFFLLFILLAAIAIYKLNRKE
jgi:hypothetical protein